MVAKRKKREPVVVRTLSVEGVTYQLKMINCGKPRCRKGCSRGLSPHGPYWYATTWTGAKTKTRYVGKELPRVDEMLERPEFAGRRR
jgi:uncharacterized protein DUF6788